MSDIFYSYRNTKRLLIKCSTVINTYQLTLSLVKTIVCYVYTTTMTTTCCWWRQQADTELVRRWISKKVTTSKCLLLLNTFATIFGMPVLMKNVGHKSCRSINGIGCLTQLATMLFYLATVHFQSCTLNVNKIDVIQCFRTLMCAFHWHVSRFACVKFQTNLTRFRWIRL